MFRFDILDEKWDVLSRELGTEEYRALFDTQLIDHSDDTPEQIKERLQKYDTLTGSPYLAAFEHEYGYDREDEFALMVSKGIIDLSAAFFSSPGRDALKEDDDENEKPPILRYIRRYVRGMHSGEAFEFMREFFRENDFAEMHRLFDDNSWGRGKSHFFVDALYEGSRTYHGDNKQRFNIKRSFLWDDEHRELFGWLDDYMYHYKAESYAEFSILMLLDPFIPTLFPKDELRRIYDMVSGMDIKVLKENERELKQKYLTETELQAEKDAETARQNEQKRLAREQETQSLRDELKSLYDGSFKSLLKYLENHKYSFRDRDKVARIASEYLGKPLTDNNNKLGAKEIGRCLQFGGKLLKDGVITFEELKKHISIIEEVADYAENN